MERSGRKAVNVLLMLFIVALIAACGQGGTGDAPAGGEVAPADEATDTDAQEEAAEPAAEETEAAPEEEAASEEEAAPEGEDAESEGSGDLLSEVQGRGTLLVATDSNYAPQSFKNPDDTWEGFDIDVAREIANRLGVEIEFLDISFDVVTAGSWNDRWDINVGSMTVTPERQESLIFTAPYYYTPAAFTVHADSTASSLEDLASLTIGVGAATTYSDYLEGGLTLVDEEILTEPPAAEIQVYDTDLLAIQDLALGDGARLDAALTALPTIQNAIDEGQPIKVLGDPVYYEQLAVALDQSSSFDPQTLADEISQIVEEMRSDGTLTELSNQYYGVDITTKTE
ncbi:MAG: transporter substrate-binding domain-containing protein [Chloroflexota bacterium]